MGALFFAAADGYVDDASEALQSTPVYVSSEVDGASALQDALLAQVGDDPIAVAVFSDNAALEASGPEIVSQLAETTGYDTIIVAVGDDLSAGSRVLDAGEAMQIANQAESGADSLGAALTETVQGVQAADEPAPLVGGGSGDGGGLGLGLGLVIGAAVLVAAGGAVFGVIRARRRRASSAGRLPDPISRHVANLRSLAAEYAQVGARGNAVAAQTANEMMGIAENIEELFVRLDRAGGGAGAGQRGIAAIEYDDTLRKLTAALDRDYLLDILTHPHLWDDPEDRVREVREAVVAVSGELVQNIKQVNARRGLHFQVSLDGLIGGRKELQEWERAFERASDGSVGELPPGGRASGAQEDVPPRSGD
ncbi:hypothetical protein GCM10017608_03430 [Agromyces luteolus]|uniref:Uncharacterized protein n=1 Tax=Agromyces luteolus TaxID=88373 RepID=A0A7C9LU69_9MICO|nr:hypothetical protein [Agromyces luteolus]MUN05859.1 hypothetical protein [Agromyces luteolus]GLK26411.1 hypothetical protein GCM10017608_03430 [Agromyces luteolus]